MLSSVLLWFSAVLVVISIFFPQLRRMPPPTFSPGEPMNRKRFLAIAAALLVGTGLLSFYDGHQVPPSQSALALVRIRTAVDPVGLT